MTQESIMTTKTEEFKFDLFAAAVEKPIAGFDLLDNIYNLPEAFLSQKVDGNQVLLDPIFVIQYSPDVIRDHRLGTYFRNQNLYDPAGDKCKVDHPANLIWLELFKVKNNPFQWDLTKRPDGTISEIRAVVTDDLELGERCLNYWTEIMSNLNKLNLDVEDIFSQTVLKHYQ